LQVIFASLKLTPAQRKTRHTLLVKKMEVKDSIFVFTEQIWEKSQRAVTNMFSCALCIT